ncbi:MAG: cystathionine gamma-synthase [Acidimicrobiales bacterium]
MGDRHMGDRLELSGLGFETRAIHGGSGTDPSTGAVNTPVHLSSTFRQDAVGVHRGFEYARSGNPTRASLEANVAALEGAESGFAFASGMAAEDTVMRLLGPGDHLVLPTDAYGGTYRLATQVFEPAGLQVTASDLDELEEDLRTNTKMVWIETPTNPLLRVIDIEAVVEIAHRHGSLVVVDNTFATPWLQQPLRLGADIVVHSTTKYLGGHSDVVGGFAATNDPDLAERLGFLQKAVGAIPGPFDCFLVQRGVKTLAVRMERHCANALAVVDLLLGHRAVETVLHPSLTGHDGHEVATRQMRGFGGIVSFTLSGGEPAALEVCRRTRIFTLAESLGAVESLIEHPGRMTHASVAGSSNEVRSDLVRLSVGLETAADLVDDLRQALDAVV